MKDKKMKKNKGNDSRIPCTISLCQPKLQSLSSSQKITKKVSPYNKYTKQRNIS